MVMRIDVRNHEIILAILLGIDDILEEALEDPGRLSKQEAVDYLKRMKVVTTAVGVIGEQQEDT